MRDDALSSSSISEYEKQGENLVIIQFEKFHCWNIFTVYQLIKTVFFLEFPDKKANNGIEENETD